jgi:hypothetical protein
MSHRTIEQIKKDYDEVHNKIILLSYDIKVLRDEIDNLIKDDITNATDTDMIAKFNKLNIISDKLSKQDKQINELGIKKIKLIEEYKSQQQ